MSTTRLPRSFTWLNVTQFLGALNDNIFRFLVVFLLVGVQGEAHRGTIVATATVAFVLPFLLFSHAAGVLADRFSKRTVLIAAKWAEVAIAALGCLAILSREPWALYGAVFLLCTHSAFFGPAKYGIIPELVSEDQLSRANSLLVGISYLAVILGAFVPSFLLLNVFNRSFILLGLSCVGVAVVGLLAARRLPLTPAVGARNRWSLFFLGDVARTLWRIRPDRDLLLTVVGSAYFVFLGGFIQQAGWLFGQDALHMGQIESGYLFPVSALGIGLGALLSGRLSGRHIEFGVVPLGALGLTVACLGLGLLTPSLPLALGLIGLLGLSAGLFVVPLDAFIQYRSPTERRGEILAATSFLSFLGIAISAGLLSLLYNVLKLTAGQCFVVAGVLTAVLTAVAVAVLPESLVRFAGVILTRCVYRLTVAGEDRVPTRGAALLVSNHVTWVDALLISTAQQRPIRFVMAREVYNHRWLKPLFRLMRAIPLSPRDHPRQILSALAEARQALDSGQLVCLFAEGSITRNGNLQSFKPGLERILKGSAHPVIPVCIGGAWGSVFSYYHGRLMSAWPRALPYPVSVRFGLPLPAASSAEEVRRAVCELSGEHFDLQKSPQRTLAYAFVRIARRGWGRTMLFDAAGASLSFGRALSGALALGVELRRLVGEARHVGILLPPSPGGALANYALTLIGKVPVNLNYTASADALHSAVAQCELRTVVSSRAFLEKLPGLELPPGVVFLEDVLARLTPRARAAAWLKARYLPARWLLPAGVGPDDPATVIFSSGSTGHPKGVVLSHHNILSNIEAFVMVVRFTPRDGLCAVLPFFHSFGFATGLWGPAAGGYAAGYHANPLDGATVARLVRERRLTVLVATPTFLLAYVRKGEPEDFRTLRLVLVGAEKLRASVADAFEQRFGIRPLEGYGATELSPVGAINLPDVEIDGVRHVGTRQGSVGHPLPGVTMRVVDPDSGAPIPPGAEGLLLVKGPNVMQGYLGNAAQTAEALKDGWYRTGDIARIDADGFVFLVDRLSRYSKVAGEMVPHLAVEEKLFEAAGALNQSVAVTSAPDERKGEQLVVFYTPEAGDVRRLQKALEDSPLPNLWKPKRENFFPLPELPQLGSGKVDLKRLRELARAKVEEQPGRLHRIVDAVKEKFAGKEGNP